MSDDVAVWLLDVDGVLNCTRPGGWRELPWSATVHYDLPYRFRWSPTLMARIRALHATGRVEIRWCTTWCPHADRVEQALKLPTFGRALLMDPVPTGPAGDRVKLDAARAVLGSGRRLVWTDDTAVPDPAEADGFAEPGRALLIRPNPRRGLLPEHMDAIDSFLGAA